MTATKRIAWVWPAIFWGSTAACGGGGTPANAGADAGTDAGVDAGEDTGGDTASADDCPPVGMGSLELMVSGLPEGTGYAVLATGRDGMLQAFSFPGFAVPIPAGRYAISAYKVAWGDPIVRTAYQPSVATPTVCVHISTTTVASVSYAPIATSNKLWVGNATGGTAPFLGFATASVQATGAPPATVAAETNGSGGFAFDRDGNVWIIGATVADPPLARFPAALFADSGPKTPDIVIDSPAFSGGVPGPRALAFDAQGNLWVSVVFSDQVVRFTNSDLVASGSPTPGVAITGIKAPSGLAFDHDGNLFIACSEGVAKVAAARLGETRAGADYTIDAMTPLPVVNSLGGAISLAFDWRPPADPGALEGLWVAYDGTIARLSLSDLANDPATKRKSVTPRIQLGASVSALPQGIAFDEGMGLWVASSQGQFIHLPASALKGTGGPDVVISSPDIGYAQWFGIYPAPAALPLYHRLP